MHKPRLIPIHPAEAPESVLRAYCDPAFGGIDKPEMRINGWWGMVPACDRWTLYAVNRGGMFFKASIDDAGGRK